MNSKVKVRHRDKGEGFRVYEIKSKSLSAALSRALPMIEAVEAYNPDARIFVDGSRYTSMKGNNKYLLEVCVSGD